ncbi:hypothetical protein GGH96_003217 [Coemansia sp. RSA 1972]|nr:hypothetical protein GGH96_003217 [Coemansia sp. RSA 1972]
MLKAFSKVFHKSQGAADEAHSGTRELDGGGHPVAKRVLERHRPAELGLDAGDARGESPRRNGGSGSGYPRPHALDIGMRPAREPGKRASLQHRMEQMQPRLHLKGPAQGVDGRFPLSSDNIEWHMRMESKYERIIRYVQDQQHHVSAIVDSAPQQDIDASVLLGGHPMHHDYVEPQYGPLKPFHSHLHPLTHNGAHPAAYGVATGMTVLAPPRPGGHLVRVLADRGYPPNAQQTNHTTTHHADAAAASQHADNTMPANAATDNEEDDDTPLAAINMPVLRPRSMDVAGMEKYMPASLDDPLPGPGSPAYGARMSMMSFHSTMAVNLNSDVNDGLSRSFSASNPLSVAEQIVPEIQTAPQVQNRLSLDAITPSANEFGPGITDDRASYGQERPAKDSDGESIASIELRVVNNISSSSSSKGDDDDDDDQPLVSVGRKLSKKHDQAQLHIDALARPDDGDDDDDQPLSALLFQPLNASGDLGSLPLPMPRHITDPDAVANLEDVAPHRSSIGDRSSSPMGSVGVSRKMSLLSRSYTPGTDNDEVGEYSTATAKRRSKLRYSTPLSPPQDGYNSLPRPLKTGTIAQAIHDEEDSPADNSGMPWLNNRQYSMSTTSVNSRKHAKRGSTLGQQLTEELQRVRENIARTRRETDRRSWQVGDPPAAQQPWMHHEVTLSETALPTTQAPDTRYPHPFNDHEDVAAQSDAPKLPSSWSYSDKQRPMSTQNYRISRWFGKPPKPDTSSVDAVPGVSASQPMATSMSSRINNKFGKLKRTFKHGPKA